MAGYPGNHGSGGCRGRLIAKILLLVGFSSWAAADESRQPQVTPPLLLAHYMPWYSARPFSSEWGWHWTMNHFNPDEVVSGQRQIASRYYPLIGPYDSGDPAVIEFHLLTMRMAGIDGVIVDWYGLTDYRDYALLHRNTTLVLQCCERLGLKFVICYEDQTIPALVEAGHLQQADRVAHAARELAWLAKYWFRSAAYVRQQGRPLLLSFGQTGLTDAEWADCLRQAGTDVEYVSQHHRRNAAAGAFDWPVPLEAELAWERFMKQFAGQQKCIPVAFPRFVDIYAEAGAGKGYGLVPDDGGQRFRRQLRLALGSGAAVVQIATWNDWGEGTVVEPSVEFGYRDLETVRTLRRSEFPGTSEQPPAAAASDSLRLPLQLLELRRTPVGQRHTQHCDEIAATIAKGKVELAAAMLRAGVP